MILFLIFIFNLFLEKAINATKFKRYTVAGLTKALLASLLYLIKMT